MASASFVLGGRGPGARASSPRSPALGVIGGRGGVGVAPPHRVDHDVVLFPLGLDVCRRSELPSRAHPLRRRAGCWRARRVAPGALVPVVRGHGIPEAMESILGGRAGSRPRRSPSRCRPRWPSAPADRSAPKDRSSSRAARSVAHRTSDPRHTFGTRAEILPARAAPPRGCRRRSAHHSPRSCSRSSCCSSSSRTARSCRSSSRRASPARCTRHCSAPVPCSMCRRTTTPGCRRCRCSR